jgi:phenylacetate-CoA ligase/benzoylacetate-CoA ligase
MSLDARYWDREFETRPWAWIESWQAQQVAVMLETLPQRSELYRDMLGPAGRQVGLRGYWVSRGRLPTLDQLEYLPFTTRDELRRAQESAPPGRPLGLQQAVPQEYMVQVVASAGTTGPPVLSGLTRRDQETWSEAIAGALWTAGIRPDDVVAHLVDPPITAGGWPCADGLRRLGAAVAWVGGSDPDEVLDRLPRLPVTAALTGTSFAARMAERAVAAGRPAALGLRKLLAGGEPGLAQPEIRRMVADGWGVGHVRETMGMAEVMAGMWSECEAGDGMHFGAAKHVVVELVDPETDARLPWADGARGEAVYTTFDRDATPVLRYRSADHLEVTGMRCACGRTSPRVHCLGRTDDLLAYQALKVFPSTIREVVLRRFGDVVQPHLRIWRNAPGHTRLDDPIQVELEVRDGVGRERWPALAQRIGEAVCEELRVRVAAVLTSEGTLPRGRLGRDLLQVSPDAEPNGDSPAAS